MGLFVKLDLEKGKKPSTAPVRSEAEILARDEAARKGRPTMSAKKLKKLRDKVQRGTTELGKAKQAERAATIAKEVSKPVELPNRPLPGQGSMASKPVTTSTVKVPEAASSKVTPESVKAWNELKEADRRKFQGKSPTGVERRAVTTPKASTPKVMTTSGTVEVAPSKAATTVESSVAEAYKSSAKAGQYGSKLEMKNVGKTYRELSKMGTRVKPPTLAQRAATKIGNVASKVTPTLTKPRGWSAAKQGAIKGSVKELGQMVPQVGKFVKNMTAPTISGAKAAAAEGKLAKAGWRAAQVVEGAVMKGVVHPTSFVLGGATRLAGGLAIGSAAEWGAKKIYEAAKTGEQVVRTSDTQLKRYQKHGKKYGLEVTGASGASAAIRGAIGFTPDIKVREVDPSLRAKKLAAGQKKFEANYYNELKKRASRNVIKGGSQ